MVITKRTLVLTLLAGTASALLLRATLSDASSASASEMTISGQSCAGDAQAWLAQSNWPADEVMLGDHIYTRDEISTLSYSQGNPVADLGLSLAAAQLNVAAGAQPSTELVDAFFEADLWLLDDHPEERRPQQGSARLFELSSELNAFNRWAADAADCSNAAS